MKKIKCTSILALLLILLSGCSDQPKSLVGTWSKGEAGFFSAQVILKLEDDGSASMTGGTLFSSSSSELEWKVDGDFLLLEKDGETEELEIISKSETDLVLKIPNAGVVGFKRIGDGSKSKDSPRMSRSEQEKAIRVNLRMISSAASIYFLEKGVQSVTINQLLSERNPLYELKAVADETYPSSVNAQDREITAIMPDGRKITVRM